MDKPCYSEIYQCQKQSANKFINSKGAQAKEIFHEQSKDYINMLSTLLKKVKQIIRNNILKLIWTKSKLPGEG